MAEMLHDLARNSIDSVGVSGAGQIVGVQLPAGPFSSMFASLGTEVFTLQVLTVSSAEKVCISTNSIHHKNLKWFSTFNL